MLELSRVLAGPWATQIFADLGAEVIKVERPGVGDDTRAWGPPWLGQRTEAPTRESAYFASANRGKRSLTLDLSQPLGRDVVRQLAARSDVVLDNFKAGRLAAWGLDHAELSARHPGLVTCSITGFGETGPERDRPGYDLLVQAMGGLMSITGSADGPPTKVGVAVADLMTGMYAAVACLAALSHRDRTGQGQHIDLSLFDTQLAWLANQGLNALTSGVSPVRRGNAHPNIVPYQPFDTADGQLIVAVGNDRQFKNLAAALGHPSWADDSRFATSASRVAHRDRLVPLLSEAFASATCKTWEGRLAAVGVPCGPVRSIGEALDSPTARARGAVLEVEHPTAGRIRTLANPIKLSETPLPVPSAPPLLGQHTHEVLTEVLRLDASAVAALQAAGVLGVARAGGNR